MTENRVLNTPMMQQYLSIKDEYEDCILFFRMGDFYEMFLNDAIVSSEVLGITLTSRSKGGDESIPMAGVPYHAVDNYLPKLVRAGYKVAICEQLSDPKDKTKKIVERGVVRIVTPGTLLDNRTLGEKDNSFVVSFVVEDNSYGFSAADVSTGEFYVSQHDVLDLNKQISSDITRFSPKECVLHKTHYEDAKLLKHISDHEGVNVFRVDDALSHDAAASKLKEHFEVKTLDSYGISKNPLAVLAGSLVLDYLYYTQRGNLDHMKEIKPFSNKNRMELDRSTIVNLELLNTLRDHNRNGSLLNVIDKTKTPMGSRAIKNWLLEPLSEKKKIMSRLEAVEKNVSNRKKRESIRKELSKLGDIERLTSKVTLGLGNPRDLVGLSDSIYKVLTIGESIENPTDFEKNAVERIDENLVALANSVSMTIVQEPPVDPKQGGLVRDNVDVKLDKIKKSIQKSKDFISSLEKRNKKERVLVR